MERTLFFDRLIFSESNSTYEITTDDGLRIGHADFVRETAVKAKIIKVKSIGLADILLEMGWVRDFKYCLIEHREEELYIDNL